MFGIACLLIHKSSTVKVILWDLFLWAERTRQWSSCWVVVLLHPPPSFSFFWFSLLTPVVLGDTANTLQMCPPGGTPEHFRWQEVLPHIPTRARALELKKKKQIQSKLKYKG